MNIHELEISLKGATHANLKSIAKEHFTPEFLAWHAGSLLQGASRAADLPFIVAYNPSELEKCIVHYASRELIGDLWRFSEPTFKRYITENGRFNLQEALQAGTMAPLTTDLGENLDAGKDFIADTADGLYRAWVRDLHDRYKLDNNDRTATLFTIYRAHSALISGGNWDVQTIMNTTFESAMREGFYWLEDSPTMTREELEKITADSLKGLMDPSNQLGIKSTAREHVTANATERGELAYIFNPESRTIIFNPELLDEVQQEENKYRDTYYDQTKLRLMCPAIFVPSTLYGEGSMLQHQTRFKMSVYTEIYLATIGQV